MARNCINRDVYCQVVMALRVGCEGDESTNLYVLCLNTPANRVLALRILHFVQWIFILDKCELLLKVISAISST